MVSRGFLIRFIDVGLILLFGFVLISDIENLSQVELSAAEADAPAPPPNARERAFVTVGITAGGLFSVTDPASEAELAENLVTPGDLTVALRRLRDRRSAEGRQLVVLIRPHEASIVQRTVDVMDVCDRLTLSKSLQMDLEIRGASPGRRERTR